MNELEKYEEIIEAQRTLVEQWGEQGKKIIAMCYYARKFDGDIKSFTNFCTACGGNLGGMLLTGVRTLYPEIWEEIPEHMGNQAFVCICEMLFLLGVQTWK